MSTPVQMPSRIARLAVVVVNYASHALLRERLPGLAGLDLPHDIVVVDNLSTAVERRAVGELAGEHGWTLVEPAGNAGFGAGVNLGVERALARGCDTVLLVNPDVDVDQASVLALLRAAAAHPGALISPRIVRPDGRIWFSGGALRPGTGDLHAGADGADGAGGWLTGACLLVPVSSWLALGGFDEDYFMYWEDVDLSWRAHQAGIPLVVVQDVQVVHAVGGTQGAGKSPLYLYYNCRNRLLFAAKNLDGAARLRWVAATPAASWRVLRRFGGRRALARNPRIVLAAVRGTLAGLLSLPQVVRRRSTEVS